MTGRQTIRAAVFCSLVVAVFALFNVLFALILRDWHNYDTINGFYEEPPETIEVIFLGASIMETAADPAQLFEEHGICGYNLATSSQPVLASYWWARETERLHGSTLQTVVLDCSMLRRTPAEWQYRIALNGMQVSDVKLGAIADVVRHSLGAAEADPGRTSFYDGTAYNTQVIQFFPMLTYHDRWESLNQDDFEDLTEEADHADFGHYFTNSVLIDNVGVDNVIVPTYVPDPDAGETAFDTEALYYFLRLKEFCESEGIQLILIKTPGLGAWGSADHHAAAALAEAEGLPFIDFNFDPYLSECGYIEATDNMDSWHPNWRGGQKVTAWLGNYLANECGVPDMRGDGRYAFMEEEMEEARYLRIQTELDAITGPARYLRTVMDLPGCVTFVSVSDDAAAELSLEQRRIFRQLGLPLLGSLRTQAAYLAMIQEGEVVYEGTKLSPYDEAWQLVGALGEELEDEPESELEGEPESELEEEFEDEPEEVVESSQEDVEGTSPNDLSDIDELYAENLAELAELLAATDYTSEFDPLTYEGMLPDGNSFSLVSGGYFNGNLAAVRIAGADRAIGWQGLNIVTYDFVRHRVVDSTWFNTHESEGRDSWDDIIELVQRLREEGAGTDDLGFRAYQLYEYLDRCDQAWKTVYAPWELEAEEAEAEGEAADQPADAAAEEARR